jgi:hypothetical protein
MAQTASVVAQLFAGFLSDTNAGVSNSVATLAADSGIPLAPIPSAYIVAQNMAIDIFEKSSVVKYPLVQVYSDRVRNVLTEKFRTFSGKIRTVAEIRVSQDRIEGLEDQLRLYADAVTQVLDSNRGSWGQGAFYTGGYEITFDPVKQGGKNFLQVAKSPVRNGRKDA